MYSDTEHTAIITAVHKERYEIKSTAGKGYARLKTKEYYAEHRAFPTVGDTVRIVENPCGDSLIVETLSRKTCFFRRDPQGHGEQAVAANFDYVFILQSLNQDFNPKRLERYLTLSFQSGAQAVIVLTKADLTDDAYGYVLRAEQVAMGVPVHAVSARTGDGLAALDAYLLPGKTVVFLGSSGVGKSSLVNALAGEDIMATGEIREDDGKGRHTTTYRQMITLESGVRIIDTPGMRELGMWAVTEGITGAFADVEAWAGMCRFRDCCHEKEPGCAVRAAIARGELDEKRLESYNKLKTEAEYADDRDAFLLQKRQKFKEISKFSRKLKKERRK